MTERTLEFLKVPGSRFVGTPVYAESRNLDALARFFYDEVLPRESNIKRLRKLLGLPERLIDEILADLVRLRYAVLDVHGQRILRVNNPSPRPDYWAEAELEFWQDDITGIVMRTQDIPFTYRRDAEAQDDTRVVTLPEHTLEEARHFRSISGARLVEMLRTTARKMTVLANGATLESVVSRRFVARQTLCLPVIPIKVSQDQGLTYYVRAPELPRHATRAWSRELNQRVGSRPTSIRMLSIIDVPAEAAMESPLRGPEPTLWELTSAAEGIDALLERVDDIERQEDKAGFEEAVKRYEDRRDALLERLDSVVAIRVAETGAAYDCHLREMWMRTERYLLLVVDETTEPALRTMSEVLRAQGEWRGSLFVVGRDRRLSDWLSSGVSPDLLQTLTHDELRTFGLCIRDGVEMRIGSLPELTSNHPLVAVTGGKAPSSIAHRALGLSTMDPSAAFIESVLAAKDNNDARRSALQEVTEGLEAYDDLVSLVRGHDGLIKRALESVRPSWNEYERKAIDAALKPSGLDAADASKVERPASLRGIESSLRTLASGLDQRKHALPAPLSMCLQINETPPLDVFIEVARAALVRAQVRSLFISFDRGAQHLDQPEPQQIMQRLLDAGIDVVLYLNPLPGPSLEWDETSLHVIQRLQERRSSPRLEARLGKHRVPDAMVVDESFVVLGQQSWFDEGTRREIFLALDGGHLAREILSLAEGGVRAT